MTRSGREVEAIAELDVSLLELASALEGEDRAAIAAAARAVEVDAMALRMMFGDLGRRR